MTGFKNYTSVTGSGGIPAQSMGVGTYETVDISLPLDNDKAVSTVKIQYTSEESFWRQMQGFVVGNYGDYTLQSMSYYTDTDLVVSVYAVNQTGGTISLPSQHFEITARLFIAPFN